MKRTANAATVVALNLVLTLIAVIWLAPAPAHAGNARPCRNDEPVGGPCVWDARHQGNGTGKSFRVTRSGTVIFLTHREAHRALHTR